MAKQRPSPILASILSELAPSLLREDLRACDTETRLDKVKVRSREKPHGTRAKYMTGCRCMVCRAANSRYETARSVARKNGDWNGIVSAARAKDHLAALSSLGVGRHSVSHASGISDSILYGIITGARPFIRSRTERRILAVDEGARAGGSTVSAAKTWRLLRELLKDGYSKVQLAEWLGNKRALQINPRRVTAETAAKVERMYSLIQMGKLRRGDR